MYVQVLASEYMATYCVMSGHISNLLPCLLHGKAISICFWQPFSYCHLLLLQDIVSGYITTATFSMAKVLQDVMCGSTASATLLPIGELLQDVMNRYTATDTCCEGKLLQDVMGGDIQ
jgi:hypothetical protein